MKFSLKPTDPSKSDVDLLALISRENSLSGFSYLGTEIYSEIKKAAEKENFTGKEGEKLIISTRGLIQAYKLLILGTGVAQDFDNYKLQKSIGTVVEIAKSLKIIKIAVFPDKDIIQKLDFKKSVQSMVEAAILSNYSFLKFKSEEEKKKIRAIEEFIIHVPAGKISNLGEAVKMGELFGMATCFARDLVNEPPEITTPTYLANEALKIAKESNGAVSVKILEKEEAKKLGMNSYLGVAKGSDEPPKFIVLSYKKKGAGKKVVLVGKGITFDSGGLSIKHADYMETMKLDMAGAAAVLAVFKYLKDIEPDVNVTGIIAACENMPSGKALKPGDILYAANGKSIEVLNTDAEGRLTLADAFSYAKSFEKPDFIIDLATLTGACMVALGQNIAGMWGNNEDLNNKILKAGKTAGEKIWLMPLETDYKDLIKSTIADVKNTQTGRWGGAITAALFLREFVDKIPWVHLDIAGPAFMEKPEILYPWGGTGFGVRLLLEFLQNI